MSPRQRDRRSRIIEATLDLLKGGAANVEVRDIVDAADVSLATVYRYFGSKEVLFSEVYLHWRSAYRDRVAKAIAKGRTDSERLRLGVHAFIAPYQEMPRMWDLSSETRTSHLPEVIDLRRDNHAQILTLFRNAMHHIDDEDAYGIVMILIAVAADYLAQWRAGDIAFKDVEDAITNSIRLTVGVRVKS
jgi:TetR/AcrR family transcriptional regulator, cholesterol catabolism regulator